MKYTLSLTLGLTLAGACLAQFNEAARQAEARLETAQTELAELRASIAEPKAELGKELALLEEKLRARQNEFSRLQSLVQGSDVEVSSLDREIANLQDTNSYIQSTIFNEYINRLELTLDPAEKQLYANAIREAKEIVNTEEGIEVDQGDIFRKQLTAIDLALKRTSSIIGGSLIPGEAEVGSEILEGQFALFGPNTFFSAGPGQSGIVRGTRPNSNKPNIYLLPTFDSNINSLVTTGSAVTPIDPTGTSRGGNMESLRSLDTDLTLMEEFAAGGPTMYPIWGLLILGILIAVFKAFELLGVKKAKESDLVTVLRELREGNKEAALSHAKSIGGPGGQMLTAAVEASDEDKEVIEEVLYEVIVKTQPRLERFLPFISVAAATAPLLGLLGTVTGMIKTFKLITIVGTGDAQSLSSGISEALITTKWGLIVAIPTLMSHAILNRMAKGVVGSMEQTAVGFLNGISEMRESK